MRILFYGNRGNICFRIARYLERKDVEVKLCLLPEDLAHSRSLPEWELPEFKDNYPDWIKKYSYLHFGQIFPSRRIKKEAEKFDLLFTSGFHIVSALTIDVPIVFYPSGGDLTQLPFQCGLISGLKSLLYRRRLPRTSLILAAQEDVLWATKFLGVSDKIKLYPFPIDLDQMQENIDYDFLKKIEKKYNQYDHVFLNLSRKNLDSRIPDYKGNDRFLKAFKKLTNKYEDLNVRLVLGMHGKHVDEFEKLISEFELDGYCDYVEHMPLPQLHAYLSLSNGIVFDQFGRISKEIAGIAREALSLGSVLVCNIDTSSPLFKRIYRNNCSPSILYASTSGDILNQMENIIHMDRTQLDDIRKKSRVWVEENLHWENRIDVLIDILEETIREKRKTRDK